MSYRPEGQGKPKGAAPTPIEEAYRKLREADDHRKAAVGARVEARMRADTALEKEPRAEVADAVRGTLVMLDAAEEWDIAYDEVLKEVNDDLRQAAIYDNGIRVEVVNGLRDDLNEARAGLHNTTMELVATRGKLHDFKRKLPFAVLAAFLAGAVFVSLV